MKKILSIWHIKDGKARIEKKAEFFAAIANLPDGEYWNTTEKVYRRRSMKQHRALFGIPYKMIAEALSEQWGKQISVNFVHEWCKDNKKNNLELLPLEYEERIREEWDNDPVNQIINVTTGEVMTMPFVPTTTKMRTIEMMEFYANLQEFGREWLGIEIPDPEPQWKQMAEKAEQEYQKQKKLPE